MFSLPFLVFVNEKGELPGAGKALFVSAAGAAVGAVFGTQTVTVFGAESTTGIAEGGRTGLTAITTGVFFLLSLLFTPLFLMIPSIATAPALVMVGIFMIEPLMHVDLSDTKTAFPVFICVAFMAFTFNIAYGILFGLLAYTGGQVFAGNARKLPISTWILTGVFCICFWKSFLTEARQDDSSGVHFNQVSEKRAGASNPIVGGSPLP